MYPWNLLEIVWQTLSRGRRSRAIDIKPLVVRQKIELKLQQDQEVYNQGAGWELWIEI